MNKKTLPLADVLGFPASDKRIDILRRIGQAGSISEAARGAGVSYKAAWQALETLGNLAGMPLVEKAVGGSGGGGAVLTPAGLRVLQAADALTRARQQVLISLQKGDATGAASSRAASALRTSMRNQFACTVGTIKPQQGQVRVQLLLTSDDAGEIALYARITRESAQLLGLQKGLPVLALCKATAVQVTAGMATRAPASVPRNVLTGTVTRASQTSTGGEIGLRLSTANQGGVQLVGFAAPGHGLKVGMEATATVDEASVVIAAAD